MTEPPTPKIVTRDEWEQARAELLVREKAHTHAGDALAAALSRSKQGVARRVLR
jgi:predicted dithiol-disulfide oxidoreductase (DUF899 family)